VKTLAARFGHLIPSESSQEGIAPGMVKPFSHKNLQHQYKEKGLESVTAGDVTENMEQS
jgi:hypothetical protein